MTQAVTQSMPEPLDPVLHGIQAVDSNTDITGQLVSRIGELYASEELHDRQERAERMIRRASASFGE
jgi:hypothetical protein